MYEPLLLLHSWVRWAVLLALIYFLFKSGYKWKTKKEWSTNDTHFMWAFNQVFGYQVLFGFTIWIGASPFIRAAINTPSLILSDAIISFWTLRHPLTMILSLGVFQIGHARAKKSLSENKYKIYFITFLIVVLLIATAIPWPWLSYGRPLLRRPW